MGRGIASAAILFCFALIVAEIVSRVLPALVR